MSRKKDAVVRWTGDRGPVAHMPRERQLTVADWAAANVRPNDERKAEIQDVTWNAANGYAVPVSDLAFLTDDEFDRFIVADPNFSVEEGK